MAVSPCCQQLEQLQCLQFGDCWVWDGAVLVGCTPACVQAVAAVALALLPDR